VRGRLARSNVDTRNNAPAAFPVLTAGKAVARIRVE
jgi:hypothetical protein